MRFPRFTGAPRGGLPGAPKTPKINQHHGGIEVYLSTLDWCPGRWCYVMLQCWVTSRGKTYSIGSYFNPIAVEKLRFVWPNPPPSISAPVHKFDPTEVFFRKPQLWRAPKKHWKPPRWELFFEWLILNSSRVFCETNTLCNYVISSMYIYIYIHITSYCTYLYA